MIKNLINKFTTTFLIGGLFLVSAPASLAFRTIRPGDISVPEGYKIEVAVDNLSAPTMVTFDDLGRMIVAESGYDGGGEPKVSRIELDGKKTILVQGEIFGKEVPITSVAFYNGQTYVVHGGTVSIVEPENALKNIITGIPHGDHQANTLAFKNGKLYLSVGTVTNSGVVGLDNAVFGWLKDKDKQTTHDVACQDITLNNNASFESPNVIGNEKETVKTSAYKEFGQSVSGGTTIKGNVKCNGAILTAEADGSNLQVYAWGFRNPYGMQFGPDGSVYVSMHGFDARGSRPIENAWDCFYKVEQGRWYGWPDFACDVPVTDPQFKPVDKPQPQFLISNHPVNNPPKPIAKFPPHAATNGFAFAVNGWGKSTDVYLALFGDFTPATGTVSTPQGVKVVKVDTTNGEITDVISNKVPGTSSTHSGGGFEHPSSVVFGPEGSMYITDWGIARVSAEGLKLEPNSGMVWKVTKVNKAISGINGGPSLFITIAATIILVLITFLLLRGNQKSRPLREGAKNGIMAGLSMDIFTMIVSVIALQLPWYAPPRVLATLVMGRNAVANILEFEMVSFGVGLIIVLILSLVLGIIFFKILKNNNPTRIVTGGIFYGLTVWALLQYFVFPAIDPLITEKGFPPFWYAVSFGVYGLILGIFTNLRKYSLQNSYLR